MSDEQLDMFAAEPYDTKPTRERVVLDPGGDFLGAGVPRIAVLVND